MASILQTTRTREDRRAAHAGAANAREVEANARARVVRADDVSVESFGDARGAASGGVDARANIYAMNLSTLCSATNLPTLRGAARVSCRVLV